MAGATIKSLTSMHACAEAIGWIGDRSRYQAWRQCERGDWLLWLAARVGVDIRLVVLAACDCAESALHLIPDGEDRPRIAIETARAWCRGEATAADVAADADARTKSLKRSSVMIRRWIPWAVVRDAWGTYDKKQEIE